MNLVVNQYMIIMTEMVDAVAGVRGVEGVMGVVILGQDLCWENTDEIQKGAPPSSAPKNGAPPFQCSPESDLDFHVELYELHIMVCLGRP